MRDAGLYTSHPDVELALAARVADERASACGSTWVIVAFERDVDEDGQDVPAELGSVMEVATFEGDLDEILAALEEEGDGALSVRLMACSEDLTPDELGFNQDD